MKTSVFSTLLIAVVQARGLRDMRLSIPERFPIGGPLAQDKFLDAQAWSAREIVHDRHVARHHEAWQFGSGEAHDIRLCRHGAVLENDIDAEIIFSHRGWH